MTVSRYTCEEVFARLDDFLDRELAPAEAALVRQHLETCEVCAGEYSFEQKVREDLKTKLRRIDLPESLTAKVRAALAKPEPDPPG